MPLEFQWPHAGIFLLAPNLTSTEGSIISRLFMSSLALTDKSFKTSTVSSEDNGKRNLLVCDDEEGPRQSLRIVFKETFNVLLADTGQRAIELAEAHPI